MIEFKSVSIIPNPVNHNSPYLIAVDVEDVITFYRWSDLKLMTWGQIKLMTWEEISKYNNPVEYEIVDRYSNEMYSNEDVI